MVAEAITAFESERNAINKPPTTPARARVATQRETAVFRAPHGRSCFAANDGETGGPKMCGSADNSDAAKGLVVDAVVAVVAAVSIYAVALF